MFDKNALNNQISSSKNSMKRAKVLVINKLVKKCRKLKDQMKKNSNEKIIKKVDTISQQISAVKKQNCLETLKKAILFDKNPKSILTNGNATVEEIAEMLMLSNKIVIEIVKRIKASFNLNDDTNPNWKELFKKGKKIESKSKIKNKTTRIRKKNYLEVIKSEFDPQTKSIPTDNNKDSENNQTEKKQINIVSEKQQESLTVKDKEYCVKRKSEENNLYNHDEVAISKKFISQSDPFFTTGSGQNYVSTICLENDTNDESSNVNSTEYIENANNKYNRNISYLNSKKESYNENRFSKRNVQKGEFKQKENEFNLRRDELNRSDKNKHPSWLAKQKIKPIIHEFAGSKIKFDELEITENDPKSITGESKNKHQSQNDFSVSENNMGDYKKKSIPDLHPSWQAKQKIKPIIQEFKGKKITFDE